MALYLQRAYVSIFSGIFKMIFSFILVMWVLSISALGFSFDSACSPKISDSTPDKGTFRQIECEISTCSNVHIVKYEKTGVYFADQWTTVFENINNTHHALDTGTDYSLGNRTNYVFLPTKTLLYIKPLKLEDHGKWRCVVYDYSNKKYASQGFDVNIFEPAMVIFPIDTTIVTTDIDLACTLNCSGSGITPSMAWRKDSETIFNNDTRYIIKGGCNETKCESSLIIKPAEKAVACFDKDIYTGVYTCVISLTHPYHSSQISPKMIVEAPMNLCDEEQDGINVWILTGFCLVSSAFTITIAAFVIRRSSIFLKISSVKEPPELTPFIKGQDSDTIGLDSALLPYHKLQINVAIDFGTMFCGYAYDLKHLGKICVNETWVDNEGCRSYKVPTCVLTKGEDDQFVTFGYVAQKMFIDENDDICDSDSGSGRLLQTQNRHTNAKDLHFYDEFKMVLDSDKGVRKYIKVTALDGHECEAEKIFTMALQYLKDHILEHIRKEIKKYDNFSMLEKDDVKWIITVPIIWSDSAKLFMRKCAVKAGIISDLTSEKLLIALEPEAASIYCKTVAHWEHISDSRLVKGIPRGSNYMMVDCGGSACTPAISDSTPDKDDFRQIECEISTCTSVSRVLYQKTGVLSVGQWTSVLESSNGKHNALETGSGYSLKNRTAYGNLFTKELLYIKPILPNDNGKWKCVVFDANSQKYESDWLDLQIYAPVCKPVIGTDSQSELHINGHVSFQCDISTCHSVSQLLFEKSELFTPHEWKPVYEVVNKTHFKSRDNDDEYTVENRTENTNFQMLNIIYLQMKDQGAWRCVVYGPDGIRVESDVVNVFIAVPEPTPSIQPSNPILVTNQPVEFTCIVDGVYPETEVLWKVNGEECSGGTAEHKQIKGGLWFIRNTIKTRFDYIGYYTFSCVLNINPRTQLQTHILVNVKEAARILHPSDDKNITVNLSTEFSLNCTGSGYNPHILWTKDGKIIPEDDDRYSTENICNISDCVGTIAPKHGDTSTECTSMDSYSGIYRCVIVLQEPYKSSQTSPYMEVFMKSVDCSQQYPIIIIVVGAVVGSILVTSVPIMLSVVRRKKRQDTETSPDYEEVGDIIPNFVPPNPANSETKQTYEEINDAIVHTIPPLHMDMLDTDRYSHCSVSEKSSEHSYDVCTTEIHTVAKAQQRKNYLSMSRKDDVTCTSKDTEDPVMYKRMDRQGNATYVTKAELIGIEYVKMESLSCDAYVNNDAVILNTTSRQGSPKYENRETRIKDRGIVQHEPETLEDIITSIDKIDNC